MTVAVVDIRVMRVLVSDRDMAMRVSMRFSTIPLEIMLVLVMPVMNVAVTMLNRFVRMLVLVSLC